MIDEIKKDTETRMKKTLIALDQEFTRIRTGRAHPSLLSHITVDYYGAEVPISQVANVTVEDSRTLNVTPWEKDVVKVVEKAIINSDLGLNPLTAGMVIRIPMPALTEERRRDLVKVVRKDSENSRVSIRNLRRDANSDLKLLLKDKDISEDDDRRGQDNIQKLTDSYIKKIDEALAVKEKELMEV